MAAALFLVPALMAQPTVYRKLPRLPLASFLGSRAVPYFRLGALSFRKFTIQPPSMATATLPVLKQPPPQSCDSSLGCTPTLFFARPV